MCNKPGGSCASRLFSDMIKLMYHATGWERTAHPFFSAVSQSPPTLTVEFTYF